MSTKSPCSYRRPSPERIVPLLWSSRSRTVVRPQLRRQLSSSTKTSLVYCLPVLSNFKDRFHLVNRPVRPDWTLALTFQSGQSGIGYVQLKDDGPCSTAKSRPGQVQAAIKTDLGVGYFVTPFLPHVCMNSIRYLCIRLDDLSDRSCSPKMAYWTNKVSRCFGRKLTTLKNVSSQQVSLSKSSRNWPESTLLALPGASSPLAADVLLCDMLWLGYRTPPRVCACT